jgi:RNA polymerase sigma-70 factor (ECF subfamily)
MRVELRTTAGRSSGQSEIDPEVLARAAEGDTKALGEIYKHYGPSVRRYVRTILRNGWDVDDVTQEVFVKILTGIRRYDPARAPFSSWTLTVARNAAFDHLRRQHTRVGTTEIDPHAPEDDVGQRCRESLREALADLTPPQREVLVLRALGGFSPPELASTGERTRGSINVLYHRARLAARAALVEMGAGPCTRPAPAAQEKPSLSAAV